MCGINGELIFNGNDRVDLAVLQATRDTLAHRGPDDAGAWINLTGQVGLGSRRLSIVDLSPAGHMPMSNEDGSIWITFNGEIYNHAKLRAGLERRGHRYRSRTDTETIVHLYEEMGERCVEQLDGMFAFAIWDENKHQLLLARDQLGKKPLYYWRDNNRLVFASEIKAILAHPRVPKRPDFEALYHYLSLAVTPAPLTLFAGIKKMKPAHTLIVDMAGRETSRCFWSPMCGPCMAPAVSEEEAARELLYLMRQSIAERMMSDVPFGVFLSGGVDSSTNVALMSQLMDRPVDTFSVALADDPESNEFNWARHVADHFHCNHHEIVVDQEMFLEFAEQMPYFQDEPLADPVCIPLYYVSKLARDNGVIVVQVGEGSDEIFAGYTGYQDVVERERWAEVWRHWIPSLVTSAGMHLSHGRPADFLRRLRDNEQIFWGGAVAFYETDKRRVLTPAFANRTQGMSTWPVVRNLYDAATAEGTDADYLQRMTYVELKQRLAELLLMRVDKMSMACSVEARVPYLDIELVEFAMRLPAKWKVSKGVGKHIFRMAVESILPPGILDRPKQGFCGSSANMLHSRVLDKLTADLRSSSFIRDLVNPELILPLVSALGTIPPAKNFGTSGISPSGTAGGLAELSMKLGLVITDDWELFGDGSGDYFRLQHQPALALLDVCDQAGAKLTLMAEAGQYWAHQQFCQRLPDGAKTVKAWEDILQQTIRRGHDVQLHLHPQWDGANYDGRWHLDLSKWSLTALPPDQMTELLQRGKQTLESLLGHRCLGFRAGNWILKPSHPAVDTLLKLGFRGDTSVVPGFTVEGSFASVSYRGAASNYRPWFADSHDVTQLAHRSTDAMVEFPIYTERWPAWKWKSGEKRARLSKVSQEESRRAGRSFTAQPNRLRQLWQKVNKAVAGVHVQFDHATLTPVEMLEMTRRLMRKLPAGDGVLPVVMISHTKSMMGCDDLASYLQMARQEFGAALTFLTFHEAIERMHQPNSPALELARC